MVQLKHPVNIRVIFIATLIKAYNNLTEFSYPIIADPKRDVAEMYGMMDPEEKDSAGIALTARAVFIIGPDKKLKLSLLYPATTGQSCNEDSAKIFVGVAVKNLL